MNTDNGKLNFKVGLDTSELEAGAKKISEKFSQLGKSALTESEKMKELFTKVPTMDFDKAIKANSLSQVKQAFEQADAVIEVNIASIKELETELARLNSADNSGDVAGFEMQKQAITENISLREKVIVQANACVDALSNIENAMLQEAEAMSKGGGAVQAELSEIETALSSHGGDLSKMQSAYNKLSVEMDKAFEGGNDSLYNSLKQKQQALLAEITERKKAVVEAKKLEQAENSEAGGKKKNTQATNENTQAQRSFRTELRLAREQLIQMEADGLRGTKAYTELQQKVGAMTDAMGDAQAQAKVLAHDQATLQGIMSGASGLSGAFTAVTGAATLFGSESEELNAIMVRLQQCMAITMGLQQVQQTLDKDSAFRLSTINGLKEWWNKLLVIGRGEQVASTAATIADTAAESANAVAKEANNKVSQEGNILEAKDTALKNANTGANIANTTAMNAGKKGAIGLAGAFRMVGGAIKSFPVFGWIAAAIGAIIGVVSHFVKKSKEAQEQAREARKLANEANHEGNVAYGKARAEIDLYLAKIKDFKGSKEEEKRLVEECNKKWGDQLGMKDSLAGWYDTLITKGEAYCKILRQQAVQSHYANKMAESISKQLDIKDLTEGFKIANQLDAEAKDLEAGHQWELARKKRTEAAQLRKKTQIAIDESDYESNAEINEAWRKAGKEVDYYLKKQVEAMREIEQLSNQYQIKTDTDTSTSTSSAEALQEAQKHADELKQASIESWRTYKEAVIGYHEEADKEMLDSDLDGISNATVQKIAKIQADVDSQKEAWKDGLLQLARIRQEAEKAQYLMNNPKASEADWAKTTIGSLTGGDLVDWYSQLQDTQQLMCDYYAGMERIISDGEKSINEARNEGNAEFIRTYGTLEQKIQLVQDEFRKKIAEAPKEWQKSITKDMQTEINKMVAEDYKMQINFEYITADLDGQAVRSIESNMQRLQTYLKANRELMNADSVSEFETAILSMNDNLRGRNPLYDLQCSLQELVASKEAVVQALSGVAEAQKVLSEAENSGSTEQLSTAKNNLLQAEIRLNKEQDKQFAAQQNLERSYETIKGKLSGATESAIDFAESLGIDISDGAKEAINKITDFAGKIGDLIKDFSKVSKMGQEVGQEVKETAEKVVDATEKMVESSSEGIKTTAESAKVAISSLEKASVIIALIGLAVQAITSIVNAVSKARKEAERADVDKMIESADKALSKFEKRLRQIESGFDTTAVETDIEALFSRSENGFLQWSESESNTTFSRLFNQYDYNKGLSDLQKSNAKWYEYLMSDLEKFKGRFIDELTDYSNLGGKFGQAYWNKFGDFFSVQNEQARYLEQAIIDADKRLSEMDEGEAKEALKSARDGWAEEYTNIISDIKQQASEMWDEFFNGDAGSWANSLAEAFFSATQAGENGLDALNKKADEMISDMVKKLLISEILAPRIKKAFDKMSDTVKDENGIVDLSRLTGEAVQDFVSGIKEAGAGVVDISNKLNDYGLDLGGELGQSDGLAKRGIATASQDSVDENNARLATIQLHTYSLMNGMEMLNSTSNSILQQVHGIRIDMNEKLDDIRRTNSLTAQYIGDLQMGVRSVPTREVQ